MVANPPPPFHREFILFDTFVSNLFLSFLSILERRYLALQASVSLLVSFFFVFFVRGFVRNVAIVVPLRRPVEVGRARGLQGLVQKQRTNQQAVS